MDVDQRSSSFSIGRVSRVLSMNRQNPFITIVDFPDPDTPVTTVKQPLGMDRDKLCILCSEKGGVVNQSLNLVSLW